MPRPKKLAIVLPSGNVFVRTEVTGLIWDLMISMGEQWGIDPNAALRIMLQKLSLSLSEGDVSSIGSEYAAALHRLKITRTNTTTDPKLPPIDYALLHTNVKTKSGFVGVYANGQGFRVMGKVPGQPGTATHYIGTFPTAEEAAWRRYLYYQANDLPYGAYEDALEALRKRSDTRGWTEEQLHKELIWSFSLAPNPAAMAQVPKQYEHWLGRDWMMENQIAARKTTLEANAALAEAEKKAHAEKRAQLELEAKATIAKRQAVRDKLATEKAEKDRARALASLKPGQHVGTRPAGPRYNVDRNELPTDESTKFEKALADATAIGCPIDPETWVDHHDNPVEEAPRVEPEHPDPWADADNEHYGASVGGTPPGLGDS